MRSHAGPAQATSDDARSLAPLLRQGDVLLTGGNSCAAALVRRLTRSSWSHVALYVGALEDGRDPRCVVEADVAAGVRAVPLSEFRGMRVRVLRPRGLDEAQRRRLADWATSQIGGRYDLAHAWALAKRLLPLPVRTDAGQTGQAASRFICSTLLAQAFLLVGCPVAPDSRYVMPRDFERAALFDAVC